MMSFDTAAVKRLRLTASPISTEWELARLQRSNSRRCRLRLLAMPRTASTRLHEGKLTIHNEVTRSGLVTAQSVIVLCRAKQRLDES